MSSKTKFGGQSIGLANMIAKLSSDLAHFTDTYFDRGYDSGGSDPIIDANVTDLDITAADIAGMVTIGQQFTNFLNNVAVVTADYDSTISKLRDDL